MSKTPTPKPGNPGGPNPKPPPPEGGYAGDEGQTSEHDRKKRPLDEDEENEDL